MSASVSHKNLTFEDHPLFKLTELKDLNHCFFVFSIIYIIKLNLWMDYNLRLGLGD